MAEALKNIYDMAYIKEVGTRLNESGATFQVETFVKNVLHAPWQTLELKERCEKLCVEIHNLMPEDFNDTCKVIEEAASHFSGYAAMFFPQYIELYGQNHWERSMRALEVLTIFSSSEFAIRPFIIKDQARAMKQMLQWSKDKNEHVRRLASEGCRPRLPWSFHLKKLVIDPSDIVLILENLLEDESLYVRKSVANNLNDISKDHPDLAIKLSQKWMKRKNEFTAWIVKHGLRTLLKNGDQRALKIIGYADPKNIHNINFFLKTPFVLQGECLEFEFSYELKKAAKIRLEFALYFLKKNGSYVKKVFKVSEKEQDKGKHDSQKSYHLKKINTRIHYEGAHFIELIINGKALTSEKSSFYLALKRPAYLTYMFLTQKNTLYTGITTDLNRRFMEHLGGAKGAKYTKANRPRFLVNCVPEENRSKAQKLESKWKALTRKKKLSQSWIKCLNL